MTDCTVFITLGSGNEFGISDSSMFIRSRQRDPHEHHYIQEESIIDLGAPTLNEFDALIKLMQRLRCHMKDE